MGLFIFLRLAFTFFRATPRPIPPEDLEVPLWFAAREASLQRDDRPFPFGKCGRLPGQKKSTGTDGSLMMIDDPWWFHNSMTQWHPMTIVDGFLSKSKALRRPNYAITFCLGKNSEWPLQKRIGHGPTMSKYVQSQGLHETRPSECPGLGKCRQWVYDRTWHAKKKAQDVKDLRCQLVERAEIFENSRGFWLQQDTSEINTVDNESNIWISMN